MQERITSNITYSALAGHKIVQSRYYNLTAEGERRQQVMWTDLMTARAHSVQ